MFNLSQKWHNKRKCPDSKSSEELKYNRISNNKSNNIKTSPKTNNTMNKLITTKDHIKIYCNNVGGIGATRQEKLDFYYGKTLEHEVSIFIETNVGYTFR